MRAHAHALLCSSLRLRNGRANDGTLRPCRHEGLWLREGEIACGVRVVEDAVGLAATSRGESGGRVEGMWVGSSVP